MSNSTSFEGTPPDGRHMKADLSKNKPWFVYGYLDLVVLRKGDSWLASSSWFKISFITGCVTGHPWIT